MDTDGNGDRPLKLAVVEILDRDGHTRRVVPVWHWPVTIGRAVECDVVLDDPHVAARHAVLTDTDGGLQLEVGQTVNGVQVKQTRVVAGQVSPLPGDEVFQVGGTRLRVRRASDSLAPERALVLEPATSRRALLVLAAALMAWSVGEQWLDLDPGTRVTDYLPVMIVGPATLAVWCGAWALGSKLFRHRFEFWPHARIAMTYLLVGAALGLLLPLVAYALSWSLPSRITGIVGGAVLWAMIWNHLTLILPSLRRVLAMGMGGAFVAAIALMMAHSYQVNDRFFPELYVTTLAPPALRLGSTVTTERFLDESRQLKAVLDAHVKDDDDNTYGWPEE